MTIGLVVTIVLAVLKLTDKLKCSWFKVFLPTIIETVLSLGACALFIYGASL